MQNTTPDPTHSVRSLIHKYESLAHSANPCPDIPLPPSFINQSMPKANEISFVGTMVDQTLIDPQQARNMWQHISDKHIHTNIPLTESNLKEEESVGAAKDGGQKHQDALINHHNKTVDNRVESQDPPMLEDQPAQIPSEIRSNTLPNRQTVRISILDSIVRPNFSLQQDFPSANSPSSNSLQLKRTNSQQYRGSIRASQNIQAAGDYYRTSERIHSKEEQSSDEGRPVSIAINLLDSIVKSDQQKEEEEEEKEEVLQRQMRMTGNASQKMRAQSVPEKIEDDIFPDIKTELVIMPGIRDTEAQEFQIMNALGYIFTQMMGRSDNITSVGYLKFCEDLKISDKLHKYIIECGEEVDNIEITKRSMAVCVILTMARILDRGVPEEIQGLHMGQYMTVIHLRRKERLN